MSIAVIRVCYNQAQSLTLIDLVGGWAMFRTRLVVITEAPWPWTHQPLPCEGRTKSMAPASTWPQRTWAPWGQKCPTYSGIVPVEKWSSSSSAYIIRRLGASECQISRSRHKRGFWGPECPYMIWMAVWREHLRDSAKLRARRFHACPEDPDLCQLLRRQCQLCRSRPNTNSGVDALKIVPACTAASAESITKFAACGSSRVSPSCGYVSVARTSSRDEWVDPGDGRRRSRIIRLPSNLP